MGKCSILSSVSQCSEMTKKSGLFSSVVKATSKSPTLFLREQMLMWQADFIVVRLKAGSVVDPWICP